MVQSINTKADLIMEGTSFQGVNTYGQIMVGDKGFEFFNGQRVEDCIQIPWGEADYVIVSVLLRGKYIPRFAVRTKSSGTFSFAARRPKELLRAMRPHVETGHMVRSLGLLDVLKRRLFPNKNLAV